MFDGTLDFRLIGHVNLPQSRDVAHRTLENRPEPTRFMESFVVEADGQHEIQLVEYAQHVKIERWPRILMRHHLSISRRFDACPPIRPAIDVHQTLGTVPRNAEKAARTMVLEAARESANAGGIKRCGDGLSGSCINGAAVELEVQQWAGCRGVRCDQVAHDASPSSQRVCRTRFVRTSRSAI